MNTEFALKPVQKSQLEQIAAGGSVHSQRARALLALDGGATQAAAAQEAGMTVSAVRYWRDKFREQGVNIFPEGLDAEVDPAGARPDQSPKDRKAGKKKGGKKGEGNAKKKTKKKKKGKK